jgi:hypothetical protein
MSGSSGILYETKADRDQEARVALLVANAWSLNLVRLPNLSEPCDYIMCEGSVDPKAIVLVEIKRRNNAHDKYDTFMLSCRKVDLLVSTASALKLHGSIVVEFTDGVYSIGAKRFQREGAVERGGRTDRESVEIEDVYHIRHTQMRKVYP